MNQLAVDGVHGPAVFFMAGETVEVKKCFAGIDIVQVVLLRVVGADGAVFIDEIADKMIGKFQVGGFPGNLIEFHHGLNHAAVDIVPGRLFAGLDFFNIPHGCLGSALLKQLFNITIQNFHCVSPYKIC